MSTIHYHTLGEPQRPPLIFLHGFMGRGDDWAMVAASFSHSHYCLLPDLPGHGGSPLGAGATSFERIAAEMVAWWSVLGLSSINLVGYSLGGRLALYLALHYPTMLKRVVLISAQAGIIEEESRAQRRAWDGAQAAHLRRDLADFLEQWYHLPLFSTLSAETRAKLIAKRQANQAEWLAQLIEELSPGRQEPVWDKLATLNLPVLLLAGALDEKYLSLMARMVERLPQAQWVVIPQAGHAVQVEQPQALINQLQRFI